MFVNQLSESLLRQVKLQQPADDQLDQLARLPSGALRDSLTTDNRRKAFWINLYNAGFQLLRRQHHVEKPAIFRQRLLTVAGLPLSLDDIEHGILRRYRLKWSLGYLPDPRTPAAIRRLAVERCDYRLHFALNCGARSCPPIAFYCPGQLDQQLDLATIAFLENETQVLPAKKEIHVTRLFLWYLGDFGGIRGIRRLLREKLGVDTTGMRLVFKEYDWAEQLEHYR